MPLYLRVWLAGLETEAGQMIATMFFELVNSGRRMWQTNKKGIHGGHSRSSAGGRPLTIEPPTSPEAPTTPIFIGAMFARAFCLLLMISLYASRFSSTRIARVMVRSNVALLQYAEISQEHVGAHSSILKWHGRVQPAETQLKTYTESAICSRTDRPLSPTAMRKRSRSTKSCKTGMVSRCTSRLLIARIGESLEAMAEVRSG